MNELKQFNFENNQVRTLLINDEPWFVGKDVAEILGYSNPRDALSKHVDSEDKNSVAIHDGNKGNPNLTIINESGVYALVFAQNFKVLKNLNIGLQVRYFQHLEKQEVMLHRNLQVKN